jgi:hypothetical protein
MDVTLRPLQPDSFVLHYIAMSISIYSIKVTCWSCGKFTAIIHSQQHI